MGDIEGAIAMYAQSITKAESIGFVRYQIFPRLKIGDLYLSAANHERAREHYVAGLEVASDNQYSDGIEEARKRLDGLREESRPASGPALGNSSLLRDRSVGWY